MPGSKRYIIIIPCYNGGDLLENTLPRAQEAGYPILVVDDGSSDKTSSVAESQGVYLVRHEKNRGKGRALRTGFTWALEHNYEAAVTLDADGQHDPSVIPELIATFEREGYHIIVGSRFSGGRREEGTPWLRHASNTLSTAFIRWLTGAKIEDIQSGFRIYDLASVTSLPLEHDGFAMETEVIARAAQSGMRMGNHPIPCHYPEGTRRSHYRPLADSWEIAKVVCRVRFGRRHGGVNGQDTRRG